MAKKLTMKETKKQVFNLRRKIRVGLKKQTMNARTLEKLYKEVEKLTGKKAIHSWFE